MTVWERRGRLVEVEAEIAEYEREIRELGIEAMKHRAAIRKAEEFHPFDEEKVAAPRSATLADAHRFHVMSNSHFERTTHEEFSMFPNGRRRKKAVDEKG